jgi:sucrose-6-phosphate hydrolase SacC (GH32 family)
LSAEPSGEAAALRESTKEWKGVTFSPGDADPLAGFSGTHFEIEAVMDAGSAAEEFGFDIYGGSTFVWNREERTFTGAKGVQPAIDGKVNVRVFVDTVSIEVFVNGTYVSRYIRQTPGSKAAAIVAKGGAVRFDSLKIHTLRSVWE